MRTQVTWTKSELGMLYLLYLQLELPDTDISNKDKAEYTTFFWGKVMVTGTVTVLGVST